MSITRHHNEWLSLVPSSGPFLSLPVLAQVFPQGLDAHDADHARRLRSAFDEWDDDQAGSLHRAWARFVLEETLGFQDGLLAEGQAIPQSLKSDAAEYGETLRPDWIVTDPATKKVRLLVQVYPRGQSLTKPVAASRWKVSPDTRMMQLLHDTSIRLGLVTNGDHWMLVNAPRNETTGYATWHANLWMEEPVTLRAFRSLLAADRLFSVPENETLEALLDKSASDQQEVTDQLGYQVRKAVEVLIQAIDRADHDHGRELLAGVEEKTLYESALTVMMRLVFLFCAEERELLLLGDDLYDQGYAVSTLREQLRTAADQHGEEILGLRHDAWARLLSTFRAVHAGVRHDRIALPAYGGNLFNPDRFPFLEGRGPGTRWREAESVPLPVSNRTVLHLLDALQVLQVRLPGGTAEARALSFRALDIEQIGHVYEGLLDHTAKRATEPMLGLQGTRDKEPEIALSELERIAAKGEKDLLKFLKDETGRSESALKKALAAKLDDQQSGRFRTACQDWAVWKRVEPFAGLARLDTVEYPVVITPGSVYVAAGTDRRSSGTHYTPKSLTEPIVQYTLEPLVYVGPAEGLPRDQWTLRPARELLELKICDMACGSGAFLVQACRYMAARLLEAWDAVRLGDPAAARITPEGAPSTGRPGELLIPDEPDERLTYALRIVAQRSLYGVDKNPLAVEMAKLSLWLLTLAKDKPFEFLDHAIRAGDSLVGIHNLDQLRKFNLDGKGEDNRLFLQFLDARIHEAVDFRRRLAAMQSATIEDVDAQELLLREANERIDRLKLAADMLIGAEFVPGSAADKRAARTNAAIKVAVHFLDSDLPTFRQEAHRALHGQTPFHWPLEFPEVMVERGGFDAFVGNPPFMGGQKIRGNLGDEYRNFLVDFPGLGRPGIADLCAYFFLQAGELLCGGGHIGLLATNTIAQGDTREVGLDQLTANGCSIPRAVPSRKWPGTANLEVAHVWLRKGAWDSSFAIDEKPTTGITSLLTEPGRVLGRPCRLKENEYKSFTGSYVLGKGFFLDPKRAARLIELDPRNKDVISLHINGDDLSSSPSLAPGRLVINFFDWPLSSGDAPAGYEGPVAADYPECLAIVEATVKPQRMAQNDRNGRRYWWRFMRTRPELHAAVSSLKWVLPISSIAKHPAFARVPTGIVFDHNLTILALDTWNDFALLSSRVHLEWAAEFSSTLETRLGYRPSDCLETFPFPKSRHPGSAQIGEDYSAQRSRIMLSRREGLTKSYNRFHAGEETSPDIQKLRELHVEMDRAVAAAYGWTDLDLGHGFHETKQGVRYTISEPARREVLARLLKLNHERYAEEVKQGLHDKKKPKTAKNQKGGGSKSQSAPSLFSDEEDNA